MFDCLAVCSSVGRRLCGVIGLLAISSAGLSAAIYQAGKWPIEVSVTPDQPAILLGEPTWLSFTVTNRSDEALQLLVGGDYQNELGRPGSFTIRAVGLDGKWVPQPDAGAGTGGLVGPRELPAKGSHVFRLFVPHWATFSEAGTYSIICRRTLQLQHASSEAVFAREATTDIAVEAKATLGVLPKDDARMKTRIADLGEQMLAANGDKPGDEAVIMMSWISDPRVVPYFTRALKIPSYAMRFVAVQVLARFESDDALAGLKTALATAASDFAHVDGDKSAELAAKIRSAAVSALIRCRHPKAKELLIAQRRDPAESVRLSVVSGVARMPAAQALPLLDEMTTKDGSTVVRDAAQRYAAVLRQAPKR